MGVGHRRPDTLSEYSYIIIRGRGLGNKTPDCLGLIIYFNSNAQYRLSPPIRRHLVFYTMVFSLLYELYVNIEHEFL